MRFAIVAVAVLFGLSGVAWAQASPAGSDAPPAPALARLPDPITKPKWARPDQAPATAFYYPAHASAAHIQGRAVVRCQVDPMDRLADCQILSEEPAGEGFGAALIKLTKIMRLQHLDGDGKPVEGREVNLPLRFKLNP